MKLANERGYRMSVKFLESLSRPDYLNPTGPQHPDSTSFATPPSHNAITLRSPTNSVTLSDTTPSDAPESSTPNPILALISTVRQQLLDHESYREPYVKFLRNLHHAKQGTEQERLRKIRPTKPTDSDVRGFFLSHWPEVHLRDRVKEHANPLSDAICGHRWLASEFIEKVTYLDSSSQVFRHVDWWIYFS